MRIVADTNVVVSAFLWGGTPRRLLDAASHEKIELYTSPILIEELERVLTRDKFAELLRQSRFSAAYLISRYTTLARIIAVTPIDHVVVADPDDDAVLACAAAAKAELIVSGDAHLLNLKQYSGINIVTVARAVEMIDKAMP